MSADTYILLWSPGTANYKRAPEQAIVRIMTAPHAPQRSQELNLSAVQLLQTNRKFQDKDEFVRVDRRSRAENTIVKYPRSLGTTPMRKKQFRIKATTARAVQGCYTTVAEIVSSLRS